MKNLPVLIFIVAGILSCSTYKRYENFEVKPILSVDKSDSTYYNELRFNAVRSAMHTKKVMYDNYGKWDREVWTTDSSRVVLIWEERKLLESEDELFSVAAFGSESWKEMYASVIVYNSKNPDCLAETSEMKDSLIEFFSAGIRNLSRKKEFYKVYEEMLDNHRKENDHLR